MLPPRRGGRKEATSFEVNALSLPAMPMPVNGVRSEARCERCGRATFDPGKRDRPWARAVASGRQILVCPTCQESIPSWSDSLDRCEACGSTRMSAMLGEIVCRACGRTQRRTEDADPGA